MANNSSVAKPMRKDHSRGRFIAICTIPAVLLYLIFVGYPTIRVFYMSLFKMGSLNINSEFVGFDNFGTLFKSSRFWDAFKAQIFFIIVVTIITMTLSMFFAAILTQSDLKEKPFYRTVFFFPNVLSMVVISVLFVQIYNPAGGVLTSIVKGLGGNPPAWLGDSKSVLWCIAAAMIWQAIGYYMVMYMAGMDGIQKDLYEVADLEGMGKFKQFFTITIPLMWEVVRVTIVFFIISTINMSFTFVRVMAPESQTAQVLLTYMYNQAFVNDNYGYAMACGVAVFLFAFILALISNKLTAKETIQY